MTLNRKTQKSGFNGRATAIIFLLSLPAYAQEKTCPDLTPFLPGIFGYGDTVDTEFKGMNGFENSAPGESLHILGTTNWPWLNQQKAKIAKATQVGCDEILLERGHHERPIHMPIVGWDKEKGWIKLGFEDYDFLAGKKVMETIRFDFVTRDPVSGNPVNRLFQTTSALVSPKCKTQGANTPVQISTVLKHELATVSKRGVGAPPEVTAVIKQLFGAMGAESTNCPKIADNRNGKVAPAGSCGGGSCGGHEMPPSPLGPDTSHPSTEDRRSPRAFSDSGSGI